MQGHTRRNGSLPRPGPTTMQSNLSNHFLISVRILSETISLSSSLNDLRPMISSDQGSNTCLILNLASTILVLYVKGPAFQRYNGSNGMSQNQPERVQHPCLNLSNIWPHLTLVKQQTVTYCDPNKPSLDSVHPIL